MRNEGAHRAMASHENTLRDFIQGAKHPKLLAFMQSYLDICEFLESEDCTEEDVFRIGFISKTLSYEVQRKRMRKEINFESTTAKRKTGQDSL